MICGLASNNVHDICIIQFLYFRQARYVVEIEIVEENIPKYSEIWKNLKRAMELWT